MGIDVQKELKVMYRTNKYEMLNYIYFELFDKKCEDHELVFKELMNSSIERYPELLNLILDIKGIDTEAYYFQLKRELKK